MARYCPDCKQVFDGRKVLCPLCGYNVVSDDQSDQVYLNMGYRRYAASPARPASTSSASNNTTQIDDADLIEQLRSGIKSYGNDSASGTGGTSNTGSRPQNDSDDFFGGYGARTQRPDPQPSRPASTSQPDTGDDFFGSYGARTQRPDPQNSRPASTSQLDSADNFFSSYHTSGASESATQREPAIPEPRPEPDDRTPITTGNRHYRVPGRTGNSVRRFFEGLGNFLAVVPWRAVFWIALIIIVCVVLYSLWQMREAILSAILDFFVSLIPAILIIAIIVWIFRRIFR
jgi:hypothetical protein